MKTKKDIIIIDGKPFEYDRISWNEGFGTMDKDVALEAIKTGMSILSKYNVKPFLMWGTLLGAIRDHGFIPHDDDVDMAIVSSDLKQLLRAIPELYANDFKLSRYKKGHIYSFLYKGVVFDIDVVNKPYFPYSIGYIEVLEQLMPKKFFSSFDEMDFCGVQVYVPHQPESLLEYRFGKDWRIPQKSGSVIVTPKWMIITRFMYRLKRKIRFICNRKFGYFDSDFF